jgi:ClpX C4-type zinc finger protein
LHCNQCNQQQLALSRPVVDLDHQGRQGLPDSQECPDIRTEAGMSETAQDKTETAQAAGGSPQSRTLYCSFCFKSQHQVKMLISGPAGIFICSDCVHACNECLAGRFPDRSKRPSDKELPTEHLLERLQAIEDTLQGKGNQLQWVVELLRSREVSWAQIGAALGISRQSAWERFS